MKNKLPHWQANPRTMLQAAVVLKTQWRTLFPYELSMLFSTSAINMPEQCITNSKAQARRPQKLLCLVWGSWKEAFTVLENMLADCASSEPSVSRKMFMCKKDKSCLILGSEATITVIFLKWEESYVCVEDNNQIITGCTVAEALKRSLCSFQQKDIWRIRRTRRTSSLTNKKQDVSFKNKHKPISSYFIK